MFHLQLNSRPLFIQVKIDHDTSGTLVKTDLVGESGPDSVHLFEQQFVEKSLDVATKRTLPVLVDLFHDRRQLLHLGLLDVNAVLNYDLDGLRNYLGFKDVF